MIVDPLLVSAVSWEEVYARQIKQRCAAGGGGNSDLIALHCSVLFVHWIFFSCNVVEFGTINFNVTAMSFVSTGLVHNTA